MKSKPKNIVDPSQSGSVPRLVLAKTGKYCYGYMRRTEIEYLFKCVRCEFKVCRATRRNLPLPTVHPETVLLPPPSFSQNDQGEAQPCSASSIREKVETERWFFIAEWCKKKGISPMDTDNFNRAAIEWVKLNCFEPNAKNQAREPQTSNETAAP